ncbi:MAG: hypothetical protein PHP50_11315 [Lachnospiraceae bacterium]|nr:hypothetical protein [Lachnospiraceae bacterium]
MKILFAGKTDILSADFYKRCINGNHCAIYGEGKQRNYHLNHVTSYSAEDRAGNLEHLIQSMDVEMMVYVSQAIDGIVKIFDELEKLEQILFVCKNNNVKHFVYITSNDMLGMETEKIQTSSRYIVMHACEKLCQATARENDIHIVILKVPFIYSVTRTENYMCELIDLAGKSNKIKLKCSPEEKTDFLNDEDLGELINRIADSPFSGDVLTLCLSGNNDITFMDFVEQIWAPAYPETSVTFSYETFCVPKYVTDGKAEKEYGWIPSHAFQKDFKILSESIRKKTQKKKTLYERRARHKKLKEILRKAMELLVLFLISIFLNHQLENNVLLNFIDFRMIFVVIIGTMNGLNSGVAAGILASLAYLVTSLSRMPWQVIFYNVQNWLPFAVYFLLGSIAGYTRDKHDDEVVYMKEEYDIMEKKYVFLNDLYQKVMESKNQFNSQIISYRDSFGKLYGVVKRLDSSLVEKVNLEAISSLEEMLDNHSVAIYSMNGAGDFARLEVCSKLVSGEAAKSIQISQYPEVMKSLYKNTVYINTECLENAPAYAAPIQRNGHLLAMVFLMHAEEHQMNMEFSNKFMILCNLAGDSIARAIEANDTEKDTIDGTRLLKTERFEQILKIKKNMRDQEYLDYVLLQIIYQEENRNAIAGKISDMIRNTDILGLTQSGEMYLLLNQTNDQSVRVVKERLGEKGILYQVVEE